MILNDTEIRRLCVEHEMISPWQGGLIREQDGLKVISYGLSS